MPSERLISLLRSPTDARDLADEQWNEVIQQGRKTQILGQLAGRLVGANLIDEIPPAVRRHLALAQLTARRRREAARWEIAHMRRSIDPAIEIVLLKGCAYAACNDANADGRIFSDIDVLVRRKNLLRMESDLISIGWKPSRVSDYDSAYYRNWMHEVPPMAHVRRQTVIDLHHAINPPISKHYIDPEKLFDRLVEIETGVFVLSPNDRIIHCALHLLQEGEPKKLLRDLFDMYMLLTQHCGTTDDEEQLFVRAKELNVVELVVYAVGASKALFGDPNMPVHAVGLLHYCILRAARGSNGVASLLDGLAGMVVLSHSHLLKMPVTILVPHLIRKGWMRMTSESQSHV